VHLNETLIAFQLSDGSFRGRWESSQAILASHLLTIQKKKLGRGRLLPFRSFSAFLFIFRENLNIKIPFAIPNCHEGILYQLNEISSISGSERKLMNDHLV